jgi:SSS family solute:Na+ symporter
MIGGSVVILASIIWPEIITPFAHGVPMREAGDSLFGGAKQYKFMRAFFGLSVCSVIGVISGLMTKGRPLSEIQGLVWGTVSHAIRNFYGGRSGQEVESQWVNAQYAQADDGGIDEKLQLPLIRVSRGLANAIEAQAGDIIYICDTRWWLGGLRSSHAKISSLDDHDEAQTVHLGPSITRRVVVSGREQQPLQVKRLY